MLLFTDVRSESTHSQIGYPTSQWEYSRVGYSIIKLDTLFADGYIRAWYGTYVINACQL